MVTILDTEYTVIFALADFISAAWTAWLLKVWSGISDSNTHVCHIDSNYNIIRKYNNTVRNPQDTIFAQRSPLSPHLRLSLSTVITVMGNTGWAKLNGATPKSEFLRTSRKLPKIISLYDFCKRQGQCILNMSITRGLVILFHTVAPSGET